MPNGNPENVLPQSVATKRSFDTITLLLLYAMIILQVYEPLEGVPPLGVLDIRTLWSSSKALPYEFEGGICNVGLVIVSAGFTIISGDGNEVADAGVEALSVAFTWNSQDVVVLGGVYVKESVSPGNEETGQRVPEYCDQE